MIPYKHRFHGHSSLRYLYNKGKTARNRSLQLRYVKNTRYPERRATVIVAKKVVKSAVVRNRIRRRIYEVLRRNWTSIRPSTDLAVTVFAADVAVQPAAELEKTVISMLEQADLCLPGQASVTIE